MRLTFLFILLLLLPTATALSLTTDINPDSYVIKINETATIDITLTHDGKEEEYIEIFSPDVHWDIRLSKTPAVKAYSPTALQAHLTPLGLNPGIYQVPLHFRIPSNNIEIEKTITLELQSTTTPNLEYLPAIKGAVNIPVEIDPRNPDSLTLLLDNQNARSNNITIKIRSNLINKDIQETLKGLEKKSIDVPFTLDQKTSSQRDTVRASIFVTDNTGKTYQFDIASAAYAVSAYTIIDRSMKTEEYFLKTIETITLTNNGNIATTEVYRQTSRKIHDFFTKNYPTTNKALTWEVRLAPAASFTITRTTSYRTPFAFTIALAIVIITFFIFRNPLIITKKASILATKEGGICELRVRIHLFNRGLRPLTRLRVLDLIPRIATLENEADLGSLAPVKILRHENKGTLLKWTLDVLDRKEERIISYKIRSKLSILGGLRLPTAIVKFEQVQGQDRSSSSQTPEVSLTSK